MRMGVLGGDYKDLLLSKGSFLGKLTPPDAGSLKHVRITTRLSLVKTS